MQTMTTAEIRKALESLHGKVWDTNELLQEFTITYFCAGACVAERKSDGVAGSLFFLRSPRFYYSFQPEVT
jgi:hypothetical protein